MVIRASIINDGDTRDVVCDAQGRLLVGGISLEGSVAIDLTDTNAALNDLINILNPASGNFVVQVDPAFPVVVDTTNPIDVNIAGIDAIFSGEGIPVRIQSADSNVDVSVSIEAVSNTAFPNGIPVRIDSIDLGDFPNGLPINFSGISAAFPTGIPIEINAIDLVNLPDGIPINITTQSEPLLVQIDTTGGPSVVNINTSQLADLINAIGADNNEVFIKDANGLLSDANPLRTSSQLVDETGTPISAANPLDVAITSDVTINLEGTLESTNVAYQIGGSTTVKEALLTKPVFQRDSRLAGDTWTTPVVGSIPMFDNIVGQPDAPITGETRFSIPASAAVDSRTPLIVAPAMHVYPQSYFDPVLTPDTDKSMLPLMGDTSGNLYVIGRGARTGLLLTALDSAFWAAAATQRIANNLMARYVGSFDMKGRTGYISIFFTGSSFAGSGSIVLVGGWSPFDSFTTEGQSWITCTFTSTESSTAVPTPEIKMFTGIDTNNPRAMMSDRIRGRMLHVWAYRAQANTSPAGTLTCGNLKGIGYLS